MDADTSYRGWLGAVARSNREVARQHAEALLFALDQGEPAPAWSQEARESFEAWCRGERVLPVLVERRSMPRW